MQRLTAINGQQKNRRQTLIFTKVTAKTSFFEFYGSQVSDVCGVKKYDYNL